jgi:microcin C transport system permease protein
MRSGTYLARRLLAMIPTLFGITLVTFLILNIAPGGPIEQKVQKLRYGGGHSRVLGAATAQQNGISEDVMRALRRQYGFDRPLPERYLRWLRNLAHLDFGESFTYGEPALDVITERFPVSLQFGVASFALTYFISVSLGLLMAWRENRWLDRALSFLLVTASSIPPFMLGIMLLLLLAGGSFLEIFPVGYLQSENYAHLTLWGKILDRAHHFILPLACYLVGSFTAMALLCRNSLLDEVRKDYVRTARAKGAGDRAILLRHVLRNAAIPLVTGIGGLLGVFLTGSVLVESVFQLQGIGQLGFQAIMARDYNVVMALIVLSSVAMLLGNLVGDIAYQLVDPRIELR